MCSLFIDCLEEKYDININCCEFFEYLEALLMHKCIDKNTAAYGITEKIITDETVYNLTDYQFKTFYKYVLTPNYLEFCKRCNNIFSWHEMIEIIENGEYCGHCYNVINKDD